MTDLTTNPDTFKCSVREVLTLGIDFTNYLAGGQTVTGATATLIAQSNSFDASAALSGIAINSPLVTLLLTGATLIAGTNYLLTVLATKNNGDKEAAELLVTVKA